MPSRFWHCTYLLTSKYQLFTSIHLKTYLQHIGGGSLHRYCPTMAVLDLPAFMTSLNHVLTFWPYWFKCAVSKGLNTKIDAAEDIVLVQKGWHQILLQSTKYFLSFSCAGRQCHYYMFQIFSFRRIKIDMFRVWNW